MGPGVSGRGHSYVQGGWMDRQGPSPWASILGPVDTAGRKGTIYSPNSNIASKSQYWHRRPGRGRSALKASPGLQHMPGGQEQLKWEPGKAP